MRAEHRRGVASRSWAGQKAHRLFVARPEDEHGLLNFMLSNSTWRQGKLLVEFNEPFDLVSENVEAAEWVETPEDTASAANEIWLPFVDVYRTKCVVPEPSFRLRLEQVTRLGFPHNAA
jgi:hypothetical protein